MGEGGSYPHPPAEMTDEQKQVLRTLYGHEFGRIVRKLGQGGIGAAYLADLTNPLQILASRIAQGEESPQLFGLADIPYNEQDPAEITSPEHRKRIHDSAQKIYLENGPPHDTKPPAALETYVMLLEAINKTLLKHKHKDHFDVVIKVLKHRTDADKDIEKILNEEARKRFIQEARVLKKLDHDNIVKLFGVVDAQSIGTCLVLEHIDGESLDARLQKQPDHRLPPEQAAGIMMRLLDAVHYMHTHGVIHRDLKPSNILLRNDNVPVIIDFGIVKDPEVDQTLVGTRLGTPAYMCPEFIRDGITKENTTPLVDVYSLGIIFFEMLAGRRAYEGTQEEIFKRALERRHPTRLTEFAGSISDEIVYLVEAARAKSPEKRLTMEEFRHRLEEIIEKKLYGRQSPRPSTTILLRKEQARIGARFKSIIIHKEELDEELASRAVEDCITDINSLAEVGLYEQASARINSFRDQYRISDTALREKLDEIAERISKGLAQKEAQKHLDETNKRIRAQDYVGAEDALKEAEKHVAALPKEEHPEIHRDYEGILNEYDTKHRMAATVIKSFQNTIDAAASFAGEAEESYCKGALVAPEKLSEMMKRLDDNESLATKIGGVAQTPLYNKLHNSALKLKNYLNKLQAFCAEYAAIADIKKVYEQMVIPGALHEPSQVQRLVEKLNTSQDRICQIEPEQKGRLYETTAAFALEVRQKLESLLK